MLRTILLIVFFLDCFESASPWNGQGYGVTYSVEDERMMWNERDNGYYPNSYSTGAHYSGCTMSGGVISNCNGKQIEVRNTQILANAFVSNLDSTKSITVYSTNLNKFPDVSSAKSLQYLFIMKSELEFVSVTHRTIILPSSLTHVGLMNNKLRWIPTDLFPNSQVSHLSFAFNSIEAIPFTALQKMSKLKYLGLEFNKIRFISVEGMEALSQSPIQHLNLSNNAIEFIEQNALKYAPNLKILELHGNNLARIYKHTFAFAPELRHLDLSRNKISSLMSDASFKNLPKLEYLFLQWQDPKLTSLTFQLFDNATSSMKYLSFGKNSLSHFPHALLNENEFPKIEGIWCDENGINNLTDLDFKSFGNNLRNDYLLRMSNYTPFQTLRNLHSLYLDSNLIRQIRNKDLSALKSLQLLSIMNNKISENDIGSEAFIDLKYLNILKLSHNRINYVPDVLQNATVLPKLHTLFLGGNYLTYISTGTFTHLTTLRSLGLEENAIITVENGSFNLLIQKIYLHNNLFRFLHKEPFSHLKQLDLLYLHNNKMKSIPLQAFQNCASLNDLTINDNELVSLFKAHFAGTKLNNLYSENNQISFIEDGTFAALPLTGNLHLQNNQLSVLPNNEDFHNKNMRKLDISHNRLIKISTGQFKNFASYYLILGQNQISHIETGAFDGVTITYGGLNLSTNSISLIESHGFKHVTLNSAMAQFNLGIQKSLKSLPIAAFLAVNAHTFVLKQAPLTLLKEFKGLDEKVTSRTRLSIFQQCKFTMYQLQDNNLKALPHESLSGEDFFNVNLQENGLIDFPVWAQSPRTRILDVSFNDISFIPLGVGIGKWVYVQRLVLRNNKLTSLRRNAFKDATGITELYLENNNLKKIENDVLKVLNHLRLLHIGRNSIRHLPALSMPANLPKSYYSLSMNADLLETIDRNFVPTGEITLIAAKYLSCSCETYYAVKNFKTNKPSHTFLHNTVCASPPQLKGKTLIYLLDHPDKAICPPYDVTVEGRVSNDEPTLTVTWKIPPEKSPNNPLTSPSACRFRVTCKDLISGANRMSRDTLSGTKHVFHASDVLIFNREYICHVALYYGGESGLSNPGYGHVEKPYNGNVNNTENLVIMGDYYDFTTSHPFFLGIRRDMPTEGIEYHFSPYGSFFTREGYTNDEFSELFRKCDSNKQYRLPLIVPLIGRNGNYSHYRLYEKDSFYPVDSLGDVHDSQNDCDNNLHNFGFTARLRVGLHYRGSETLTFGGADDLWVYLHGISLGSLHTERGGKRNQCFSVTINETNAEIHKWRGEIGEDGRCILSTTSHSQINLTSKLERENVYGLEIFIAQRYPCYSRILLDFKNALFNQFAPISHLSIPESIPVNYLIESLPIRDMFTVGPDIKVKLKAGNEQNNFKMTEYSSSYKSPQIPDSYGGKTSINANITYFDCDNGPPLSVNSAENDMITTQADKTLVLLRKMLDYEIQGDLLFVSLELEDLGHKDKLSGIYTIQIRLSDVNEHCPRVKQTSFSQQPIPVMSSRPFITIPASDADATKTQIDYYASDFTVEPPVDKQQDVHQAFYPNHSTLTFIIHVVDGGPLYRRGTRVIVKLKLSNTCIADVNFNMLRYELVFDRAEEGHVYFRVPKFWVFDYKCMEIIGMAVDYAWITDSQLRASSSVSGSSPGRARLNNKYDPIGNLSSAWIPEKSDKNPWIQVDLLKPHKIKLLQFQGQPDSNNWVTAFRISYKADQSDSNWKEYVDQTGSSQFSGNEDSTSVVNITLTPLILGTLIRIHPVSASGRIALRFELIGCSIQRQILNDETCQLCPAGYYCVGDGGRTSCTTEYGTAHSQGGSTSCYPCPKGKRCADGITHSCSPNQYAECTRDSCLCKTCQPGYACNAGRKFKCLKGTYSDGSFPSCQMCPAGTYQDQDGQSICKNCPAGKTSTKMKSRCSMCPPKTYSLGDGSLCKSCQSERECPCLQEPSPCYSNSNCFNLSPKSNPKYECGSCPPGLSGDGVTCKDNDECEDVSTNICWKQQLCLNTNPGYQCKACPQGYSGNYEDGLSVTDVRRVHTTDGTLVPGVLQQSCGDVDECTTTGSSIRVCAPGAQCSNTVGNYSCGPCSPGYLGDAYNHCYYGDYCSTGQHLCHKLAQCIYIKPGIYKCECKPGYAGDGTYCGTDYDADGYPDEEASCGGRHCRKDNCPQTVNSGQEDADNDNRGDVCDEDIDNDGSFNDQDQCPYNTSFRSPDSDGDGVADACDNCQKTANTNQLDTDLDGSGDECDADDDDDGVPDGSDNCRLTSNKDQKDTDADGVGDPCDNCPTIGNSQQENILFTRHGDACLPANQSEDIDGDTIPNEFDNCQHFTNFDQLDTDGDGEGDVCDSDIDGDGLPNDRDNCPLVSNIAQTDTNYDGIGDKCSADTDGDSFNDTEDDCPFNKERRRMVMRPFRYISLDGASSSLDSNKIRVYDGGHEVSLLSKETEKFILIGPEDYGAMKFQATIQTLESLHDNYTGLIFGYQSIGRFYAVVLRHDNRHSDVKNGGIKGISLKVVDWKTTMDDAFIKALWKSADTVNGKNRVAMLWQDPQLTTWDSKPIRLIVSFNPSIGRIRIQVHQGVKLIVDSKEIYSSEKILGGSIGLLAINQRQSIWSNLRVECLPRLNQALRFNSDKMNDAFVKMPSLKSLYLHESFSMEVWIRPTNMSAAPVQGIFCSSGNWLCVYIKNECIYTKLGSVEVKSKLIVIENFWNSIIVRYSIENHKLEVTVTMLKTKKISDSSALTVSDQAWDRKLNDESVFLGKDAFGNSFYGDMDELRIFKNCLPKEDIIKFGWDPQMIHLKEARQVVVHFDMNGPYSSNSRTLLNKGQMKNHATTHNTVFVESWLDGAKSLN